MPLSSWTNHLDFLVSPVLLEGTDIKIDGDLLTIDTALLTIKYHRRISCWQIVVNVTVARHSSTIPSVSREARVAYNVEADKVFRDFWMAAEERVASQRTAGHDKEREAAIAAIKNFLKPRPA